MSIMTANDLKRGGVSGIEKAAEGDKHQVLIDVSGKQKTLFWMQKYLILQGISIKKALHEAMGNYRVIDDVDNFSEQLRCEINYGV